MRTARCKDLHTRRNRLIVPELDVEHQVASFATPKNWSGCAHDDIDSATATPCADVAHADTCITDDVLSALTDDRHAVVRDDWLHVATVAVRACPAGVGRSLLVLNADRADGVNRLFTCVRRNGNTRLLGHLGTTLHRHLASRRILDELGGRNRLRGLVAPRVGTRRDRKVADRVGGARCATRHRCEKRADDDRKHEHHRTSTPLRLLLETTNVRAHGPSIEVNQKP